MPPSEADQRTISRSHSGQIDQVKLRGSKLYYIVTIMDTGNPRATTGSRARNRRGKTVEDAIDRYLNHKLESGGSRSSMGPSLRSFAKVCKHEEIERVDELESKDLREFGLRLADRYRNEEIAGSTANTYFAYVRAFLSFCVRDELLDTNPADTEIAEEFLPEDKPSERHSSGRLNSASNCSRT